MTRLLSRFINRYALVSIYLSSGYLTSSDTVHSPILISGPFFPTVIFPDILNSWLAVSSVKEKDFIERQRQLTGVLPMKSQGGSKARKQIELIHAKKNDYKKTELLKRLKYSTLKLFICI